MESDNGRDNKFIKIILLVAGLIVLAGAAGWAMGRDSGKTTGNSGNNQGQPASSPESDSTQGEVKSVVSYTLPDGWRESSCPSVPGAAYVAPNGTDVDCSANPSSPVKISLDSGGATDCNQLQNVQNVRKHICSSVFINGRKTLKAETQYNQESSYKKDTTVLSYHLDSGKGVIKVEYIYEADNRYGAGFEQLANSIRVK